MELNSVTITKIAPALLAAQKAMGNATKGASNPFFKSTYADLNAVREATIPVLNANGISALQRQVTENGKNYVQTLLLHESGEFLASLTEIRNTKGDAQSEGSGISYARRYGLQSFLNIGAVDDDGEGTMVREAKEEKKPAVTKSSFKKPLITEEAAAKEMSENATYVGGKFAKPVPRNLQTGETAIAGKVSNKDVDAFVTKVTSGGDDW